ncbi:PD-(D/E)XK nuclease family protein [Litchfieldia salsa]|uniref:ATP-dependent helicase/nuclease subunit B n=1 Tax=Litchfieldia salsa TaxID=930152 RepID=A0A1H0T863_9BACI|nr:PD-(D/E)XK nuclease family protein [Litchfieldia salsa]SDP50222.1 ATP-dependent helicase/nuclease subunit B [Litchfieldia salsa]
MELLIKALHQTCQTNLLNEKILVVDSYSIGEQIISHYMKEGYNAVNLKVKTVRDLALGFIHTNDDFCNTAIGSHLVYSLLKQLKFNNSLRYFHNLEITPNLSHGMYEVIQELRLAGYTSNTINDRQFVITEKGQDIIHILKSYEETLKVKNLKDNCNLYQEALKVGTKLDCIFLLQSNLNLSHLEEQFIGKIISDYIVHLPLTPVYGVVKPQSSKYSMIIEGEPTPHSYLYHLDASENIKGNLSLFTTKTEEHELKEVLKRIAKKQLPFDHCAVYYSQSNPYITTMYHLSEEQNFPVTFNEGIPIQFTKPGKLMTGLLKWIKSAYSVTVFVNILQEGLLNIEGDGPSNSTWITLLRKANIGWDATRYKMIFQNEIKSVETKLKHVEDQQKRLYLRELREHLSWLSHWYQTVFEKLPPISMQSSITYETLLLGLQDMIRNYSKVSSSYDLAAKESLIDTIDNILPYVNESLTVQEGIERLEELVLQLKIGASKPKPGYLHFCSFENGLYISRDHVFIVGLDNQRFPGGSGENPLLLDIERKRLGRCIPLLQEKSKTRLYKMLQVLASSSRNVTLSYCQFDVNENRATSPAHLFLQSYRLQSGNKSANFKDLKQSIPVIEESIIHSRDWWADKLNSATLNQLEQPLLSQFEHICRGLIADEARQSDSFTVYDGKIISNTSKFDPRLNKNTTISAGKLEMLATCPYSYFLQVVLNIKPIEDTVYTQERWLDPVARGTLLHEVFELFYRKLQELNEKPSFENHHSLIVEVAQNSLAKIKEILPPPSENVELQEITEVLESCETFLKLEEENSIHGSPKYFEYSFGVDGIEPAIITLPSGTFHVSGKIDRVDLQPDGTYHIIDYKTGSTWGYDGNIAFRGGRQLQHLLYTLAIENHLSLNEGAVQKSSYLFPTKKGLGRAYERKQLESIRTNGRNILENLLTVIEHGHFTMTDDENDCKYCQLKDVCRRSTYDKDQVDIKHQDIDSIGVRSFKGVRAYD